MTKKISLIVILSLLLLNGGAVFLPEGNVHAAEVVRGEFKQNEILVKFKDSSKIERIVLDNNETIYETIQKYEASDEVEFAEPNYFVEAETVAKNDPYLSKQWYLDKVKAREAWKRSSGSEEIVVAVLDTGVDIDHPDLKKNIWVNEGEVSNDGVDNDGNIYVDDVNGWDFVAGDNNPRPDFKEWYFSEEGINHGTIIAGVIAAVGNNSRGIAGVAWESKIMPVRVLDSAGSGDVLKVIEGIDYAVEKGADVINLSFIGAGFSKSLFLALERAYKAGVVVVAAVGNQTSGKNLDEEPLYPVCYYGGAGENIVMGVAAINEDNQLASFSNYGSKCVDVSAPGVDFWSTTAYNPGEVGFDKYYSGGWSGSSVAAPLVAGTAALIKSINPSLGVQEIRSLITANADNIDNYNPEYRGKLGKGRLNVEKAVEAANLTVGSSQFSLQKGNILVAPLRDHKSEIKFYKEDATFVKSFSAYNDNFLGGIDIASSDIDGNGASEIITGAGPGGGPHVRIFRQDGTVLGGFMAYDSGFRGGVNVAAGDIDGDGKAEIVVAPKTYSEDQESAPVIKVFGSKGELKISFAPFDDDYLGGIEIDVGKLDGDKFAEIAVSKSNGNEVRVYGQYLNLRLKINPFLNFSGGVSVHLGDLDGDKVSEVIIGAGPGGGPYVKIYNSKGVLRNGFFAFHEDFDGGITVGLVR